MITRDDLEAFGFDEARRAHDMAARASDDPRAEDAPAENAPAENAPAENAPAMGAAPAEFGEVWTRTMLVGWGPAIAFFAAVFPHARD